MNAKTARRLRAGDFVIAAFGTSHRRAQIMRIEWPHFHVHTTLKNGEERVQRSRYQSLHSEAAYGDYNH